MYRASTNRASIALRSWPLAIGWHGAAPWLLLISLASLMAGGCKSPIGVRETGFGPVYKSLRANVLDAGKVSARSQEFLEFFGLSDDYEKDPKETIARIEALANSESARGVHVVLAELYHDLALDEDSRQHYLTSAIHAYFFLFGDFSQAPNPYSPRFRLACDLYNRGLAKAMLDDTGGVVLASGEYPTPVTTVEIECTRPGFPWDEESFSRFLPADAFDVRGLRIRVRDFGLGVPLIAVRNGEGKGLSAEKVGRGIKLPATAFLRLHGGPEEFQAGTLTASLELYLSTDVATVSVGELEVPLEADITTPLAYTLEESDIWGFGLSGFFSGTADDFNTGVFMLQPYQPGKIPLVLIHGTASSPATWAQTVNGIMADPRIRKRYQVWFGMYNTGNPIIYSASLQRKALADLVAELDPQGTDPALSKMVLVGHSQGGLISRLLVTESGDRIWASITDTPFADSGLEGEVREIVETSVFFEPLPFVQRVIFISTPHRGSFVAKGWLGKFFNRFVELPNTLIEMPQLLLKSANNLVLGDGLPDEFESMPTSVDNMDPDHRFVKTLAILPFGQGVHLNSIVAVKPGSGAIEGRNDGVVEYTSAHLEEAESELVVTHGHSCQGEPATIIELRRLLLGHLGVEAP